jgi:hypothetical protein
MNDPVYLTDAVSPNTLHDYSANIRENVHLQPGDVVAMACAVTAVASTVADLTVSATLLNTFYSIPEPDPDTAGVLSLVPVFPPA